MREHTEVPEEALGPMSFEEFLAFEQQAEFKHEFVDGYVYPHGDWATGLAGAGRRHNLVAGEIQYLLRRRLESKRDCAVYGSDMMLKIDSLGKSYYPDVQLVCDPTDIDPLYVSRPCLIVEVLSANTRRIDRGEKLLAYQGIETLQAYWIVDQQRSHVTRWWRGQGGVWSGEELTSGELPVPCLDARLALDAIYARANV